MTDDFENVDPEETDRSPLTDAEFEKAKTELARQIQAFYDRAYPGCYVNAWVLSTHRLTPALEKVGRSSVGCLAATGQAFPLTRGVLEYSLDQLRG